MIRDFKGKPIIEGQAEAEALVTLKPMNFTASFTKIQNLAPWRRAEVQDRHHDLYRQKITGKVLIFPAAIGSTYTGMVLLNLIADKVGPAAMVLQDADSLLVSGVILADVWFGKGVPVVEYQGDDLYKDVRSGDIVSVNGHTGAISWRSR